MKQSPLPQFDVSRETNDKLSAFMNLTIKWSDRINLVSHSDLPQMWCRHIEDSLQLAPILLNCYPPALDLGSGAGFPGLILSIVMGFHFHLVESDKRKAAFLREAARITASQVTIHATRIESLTLQPVRLITSRALAPVSKILEFSERFLHSDGSVVLLKGMNADRELTHAAAKWQMNVKQWQSRSSPEASVLQLSEIALVTDLRGVRAK